MTWSLSASSWQTTNEAGNQSTVWISVTASWSYGSAFIDSGPARLDLNIGGQGQTAYFYTINGSQTSSGSQHLGNYGYTFDHNTTGYRGDVGTSARLYNIPYGSPKDMSVGGGTQGAIDYYRPAGNPGWMSVSNVAQVITGSWGDAPAPFGPVSYYWVYRSSANGGATWGGWSGETGTGTGKSFSQTFSPGLTYQFAVRAANSDGGGGWTYSNTIFLSSGGKRYTGTNWALTSAAAKRYTGSAWVNLATAKRFDGTNWVNLS